MALFYLIIDVWGFRRWAVPFMAIGANSIFAYMAWGLCSSAFRSVSEKFLGGLQPYVAQWCQTIADYCGGECRPEHIAAANNALITAGAMAVLWILLGYMYSKKTFIRI